jgi:hypothetical protein
MDDDGQDRSRDFACALLFAAIGIGAIVIAGAYPVGTTHRIGPGALPLGIGVLIIAVAAILAAQAYLRGPQVGPLLSLPKVPAPHVVRAVVFVTVSLIVFALLIRPMGLFPATAALAIVARQAEPGASFIGTITVALVLAAVCSLIFVTAIGLPFRVWPA